MKTFSITCATIFILALSLSGPAQNLPAEMHLSSDGRMLFTGGQPVKGLYDSAVIRSVYLDFSQPNYWQLLQQNYTAQKDIPAKMKVDGKVYDSVGVRFRGQTSYQQTQNSEKKSFNISLDFVHEKQDIMGYNTLNLNNCFLDRSFMREVFYQHQIRKHIPAAKSNFVRLYLNGADWGLYPSVQQLNKDFLKEWFISNDGTNWRADRPPGSTGGQPGWGDGTAALNYLGTDTAQYKKYYTLKSAEQINPWNTLVATCNALNNTPLANLPSVLPSFLDVDRTLWHLASEIAFSDDDSYVFKGKMDYYLYYEPETGRITPLEYDGNSVMTSNNVNWSAFYNETKVNYPLMNKLFAVPQWRQRYLAHLRTIIAEELDPVVCASIIDKYKSMIDSLVQSDPKKLYTYQQFVSEIPVLKNFITNRWNYLLSNSEVAQVAPVIQSAEMANISQEIWKAPAENEDAIIRARIASTNGIERVNLYYSNQLVGNFTSTQMYDDGLHNDQAATDGVYGAKIPGQAAGSWVRFYVEAVSANTARSASYFPVGAEHTVFVYIVQPKVSTERTVVINELMASNSATVKDESGEYDDWIELYNTSNQPVGIGGYYLTDNPVNVDKWMIPQGTTIPANGYMIFWADEDSSQGAHHLNFKLSSDGETLMLLNSQKELVDSVNFGKQTTDMGYARVPNGTGRFIIQTPTFGSSNSSGNRPPEITSKNPSSSNLMVARNKQQAFSVSATDQDNDPLSFIWKVNDTTRTGATSSDANFLFPILGYHSVKCIVSDGSETVEAAWTVQVTNTAPVITGKTPSSNSLSVLKNMQQSFSVTASDENQDALTYQWKRDGMVVANTSSSAQLTFDQVGASNIECNVSDGAAQTQALWIVQVVEGKPVITSRTPDEQYDTVDVRSEKTYSVIASSSGDPLIYLWLLNGIEKSRGPQVQATLQFPVGGDFILTCIASNIQGSDSTRWNLFVNYAPKIVTRTPTRLLDTARVGENKMFSITAVDSNGTALTIIWKLDNIEVKRGSDTQLKQTFSSLGSHTATVIATDGLRSDSIEWSVVVLQATSVNEPQLRTYHVELHQNYPNPFTINTMIRFDIADDGTGELPSGLELKIFDLYGRSVFTITTDHVSSNTFIIRDSDLPGPGIYLYQLTTPMSVHRRSMIYLK